MLLLSPPVLMCSGHVYHSQCNVTIIKRLGMSAIHNPVSHERLVIELVAMVTHGQLYSSPNVHSHILDIAFPVERELAIGESLPERVLESYLDGGLLVQLQTLGGHSV